jgi:hypothetical protein
MCIFYMLCFCRYLAFYKSQSVNAVRDRGLNSSFFWIITRRKVVINRRFRTTYLSYQGLNLLSTLTLENGRDR